MSKVRFLIAVFILLACYSLYQFYVIGNYKVMVSELEMELKRKSAENEEQLKLMEACGLEAAKQREIVDELRFIGIPTTNIFLRCVSINLSTSDDARVFSKFD